MSKELTIVAKRLARTMAEMIHLKDKGPEMLGLFMGYGLSLAIVYEAATGMPAKLLSPMDTLRWAKDLPLEAGEKRIILQ